MIQAGSDTGTGATKAHKWLKYKGEIGTYNEIPSSVRIDPGGVPSQEAGKIVYPGADYAGLICALLAFYSSCAKRCGLSAMRRHSNDLLRLFCQRCSGEQVKERERKVGNPLFLNPLSFE
jgi:hypothetical protein